MYMVNWKYHPHDMVPAIGRWLVNGWDTSWRARDTLHRQAADQSRHPMFSTGCYG